MTKVRFLEVLKTFTEDAVSGILLPVQEQKEDGGVTPDPREAEVYSMRLIKSTSAKKAAPYIIHQIITGKDSQVPGGQCAGFAVVRSIFCVYNEDEQEGALSLLELMERLRIALLKAVVIGGAFMLDLTEGVEMLVYPDDTSPFYAGEMVSTWSIPGVPREVPEMWE
ncbi:MAG: hypothetical protein FWE80_01570 [Oscillospiraceae bacterium]|nr:hypothetical protein [Oscillospiraceae bacterium]